MVSKTWLCSPLFVEDSHFDLYSPKGWNQHLVLIFPGFDQLGWNFRLHLSSDVMPLLWKVGVGEILDHLPQVVWKDLCYCKSSESAKCSCEPGSKLVVLGMAIPPLIGNPYNGYINPYYWVDDHPLLYGNNGSLDPSTCKGLGDCLLGVGLVRSKSRKWPDTFGGHELGSWGLTNMPVAQTLLGQWLNFKLFGITYLVGKTKFKLFFSGSIV